MDRREFLAAATAALVAPVAKVAAASERHLLYIAEPGIRNYVDYGGVGVLVYDIGAGYQFLKRIPTWDVPAGTEPDNVKGVAASARTGRIFVSTIKRLCAIDLITEQVVWDIAPEGGCDRLAISPQCGFASTVAGNPLSAADQWAKLKMAVDAAEAIWNTAIRQ